jgi:GTP cyclohydrolase I
MTEIKVRDVSWSEVMERVRAILPQPGARVYGVPRGGAVVAGLMHAMGPKAVKIVGVPHLADVVVDDTIDTGRTRERLLASLEGHHPDFKALFDRTGKDKAEPWLRFPWEHVDQTRDIGDTVVRQLQMIGEDPSREGLRDTPQRYLKALQEMTSGLSADPTKPLKKIFQEDHDEIVILKDTPFVSLCEHHLLPFTGTVDFAYLPKGNVVGLSKIPRFIEILAKRPQVQERLTAQIADVFMQAVDAQGVMVVVRAEHSCKMLRGARSPGQMVTSVVRGFLKDDAKARYEVLSLMAHPR